jgi:hypothetical protein
MNYDPRKLIVDRPDSDSREALRMRLEQRVIEYIFKQLKRHKEYLKFLKNCRVSYGESKPSFRLFRREYQKFPILLEPGDYGYMYTWNAWDMLNGINIRNSNAWKEHKTLAMEHQLDEGSSHHNQPIGIVFQIGDKGLFVLHDWPNSEYIKNPNHCRLTTPLLDGTQPLALYTESLRSLLEDIGDSWIM